MQGRWHLTPGPHEAPFAAKHLPHGPNQRGLRECADQWLSVMGRGKMSGLVSGLKRGG